MIRWAVPARNGRISSCLSVTFPGVLAALTPDRDVDRRAKAGRRDTAGRRAHQVHGLRRAQVTAERASRRALMLAFEQGHVPAGFHPAAGLLDLRQLAAA